MTSTAGETGLFKIQKTPDKGQGVFATTDITAGTRIIFERPRFTTQSLYPPGYIGRTGRDSALCTDERTKTGVPVASQQFSR